MTRRTLLNAMYAAGAFAPFRFLNRGRAVIVMYHRFGSQPGRTPSDVFAAQLEYLKDRYQVVPLSELVARLQKGGVASRRLAAVTIDDGYLDCHDVALPLLRHLDLPATLFITTGFVDQRLWLWPDKVRHIMSVTRRSTFRMRLADRTVSGPLAGEAGRERAAVRVNNTLKTLEDGQKEEEIARLASLLDVQLPSLPPADVAAVTWDQVRTLEAAGVEIGAHTVSHPILTRIPRERLVSELNESRARIERMLGHPATSFCYPNGDHDREVILEVERAGYSCAVTAGPGFNDGRTHPFALRRIPAPDDLPHFVQSSSGFEQMKDRLRKVAAVALPGPW